MTIIERLEGNIAILEDNDAGKVYQVDRNLIAETAREGDVVEMLDNCYRVNAEKTAERREAVIKRLRRMGL